MSIVLNSLLEARLAGCRLARVRAESIGDGGTPVQARSLHTDRQPRCPRRHDRETEICS